MSDELIVDEEAERAVLGAVVLSARSLPPLIVDEGLAAGDFYRDLHRTIFAAMLALHDAGEPIDKLTIARKASIDANVVDLLAAETPAIGNVRHHARLVKRAALRRRWQTASHLLGEAVVTDDEKYVAQAEQHLAAPTVSEDTYSPDRLADEVIAYFDTTNRVGISTGFRDLDDIIGGGFRRGDMTILAGWENMAKSPLLDQWLSQAAAEGLRSHIYINEMSAQDRALRMVAHAGAAPWSAISSRTLTDRQNAKVFEASGRLPFAVTDSSQWSADQIARHIRVNRWDICGLDVLHNMDYRDESELRKIATTLTAAARSAGTHLIIVCHLNQERAKTDELPRPVLRDLRGSGMLSKLATSVLMLHREQHADGGFVRTDKQGTIQAAKAKHGRTGDGIEIHFEFETMSFRAPGFAEINGAAA